MIALLSGMLLVALAYGAMTDLGERLIYNMVPVTVLAIFAMCLILPDSGVYLPAHLISFAIAAVIGCSLFFSGVMGGGDVKLFAALAVHYPVGQLLDLALAVTVLGALLGLLFALVTYFTAQRQIQVSSSMRTAKVGEDPIRRALKTPIPYGCAIFLGHIWMLFAPAGVLSV